MSEPISPEEEARHTYGYPPALAKACADSYQYSLKLRTGEVVNFESAVAVSSEWVHLDRVLGVNEWEWEPYDPKAYTPALDETPVLAQGRGVDVRIDQIVWVLDHES